MKKFIILICAVLFMLSCAQKKEKKQEKAAEPGKTPVVSAEKKKQAVKKIKRQVPSPTPVAEDEFADRIEKNGIIMEINDKNEVKVRNSKRKILWKYEAGEEGEIYNRMLSNNGRYAYFKYVGQEKDIVMFIDVMNKKTDFYDVSIKGDDHDRWETYSVADEGKARVVLNTVEERKILKKVIYTYDFIKGRQVKENIVTSEDRRLVYFNTDLEDEAYQDMMFSLKYIKDFCGKNHIFLAEIARIGGPAYIFIKGDTEKEVEPVMTDADLKEALKKFYGIN